MMDVNKFPANIARFDTVEFMMRATAKVMANMKAIVIGIEIDNNIMSATIAKYFSSSGKSLFVNNIGSDVIMINAREMISSRHILGFSRRFLNVSSKMRPLFPMIQPLFTLLILY